jgi:hypothetical protein
VTIENRVEVSRKAAKRSSSAHLAFIWKWKCPSMQVKKSESDPVKANANDSLKRAAEEAGVVLERPILYELAKIDPNRSTIVGIDVRIDGPTTGIATVIAIDRLEHSIPEADIERPGQSRVEIPVLKFSLPEPTVEDFMMHTFDEILIKISELCLADELTSGNRH